jgi:hypothetical protein
MNGRIEKASLTGKELSDMIDMYNSKFRDARNLNSFLN